MARIAEEQPIKAENRRIFHIKSRDFSPYFIAGVIIYLGVAFLFLFYTLSGQPNDFLPLLIKVKEVFPYLLAVIVILSFSYFFYIVDKFLP
jgi:hypothetical protein